MIFLAIIIVLAGTATGCGSSPEIDESPAAPAAPTEYSIADLAEIAGPSIAYIEAEEAGAAGYYWIGSGFVVGSDGIIVTNYHVLDGAVTATVEVNGQIYNDVTILAANEEWDLAVLKIDAAGLTPLNLAESIDDARLGEAVIAMGNPEGLKRTVSDGIISTLYRRLDGFNYDHVQTTAPISKGSSGGPLLNMQGQVIGVNTLTYLTGQNLNFAVPIDLVHNLLDNLEEPQTVAAVFSGGAQNSGSLYEHRTGELAVVLSWQGDADLDLEIWTTDFEFIGAASVLGDSPDINYGGGGEEWFAFTSYVSAGGEDPADYSSGRYLVAVYYYGPEPDTGAGQAEASVSVYYPDGSNELFMVEELLYSPPYDQWFCLLVDADRGEVKLLDLYFDAPLVALLEWDSPADLDLLVNAQEYGHIFIPYDFWYGYDIIDGSVGLESFRFGYFETVDGAFDFTTGLFDLLVYMENPGNPPTTATLTMISDALELSRYTYTFTADPAGEYFWLAVSDLDVETLEFYEPAAGFERLYLEE